MSEQENFHGKLLVIMYHDECAYPDEYTDEEAFWAKVKDLYHDGDVEEIVLEKP